MNKAPKKAYAAAGVDIDLGNRMKNTLPGLLASTHRREVLGKVGGEWAFVGNQRPYNAYVQTRLKRKLNLNRAGAEAPDASYFLQDRYESTLRLIFDLSTGDTTSIQTTGKKLGDD